MRWAILGSIFTLYLLGWLSLEKYPIVSILLGLLSWGLIIYGGIVTKVGFIRFFLWTFLMSCWLAVAVLLTIGVFNILAAK